MRLLCLGQEALVMILPQLPSEDHLDLECAVLFLYGTMRERRETWRERRERGRVERQREVLTRSGSKGKRFLMERDSSKADCAPTSMLLEVKV
jgi:hypothetical protein